MSNRDAARSVDGTVQAEEIAKTKRSGMWSDPNAVAPWDWRKQNRGR